MPIFRPEILSLPNSNEIEITVFGPGYGESLVLYIPGIGWGVIDSCVRVLNGNPFVLPLEYLLALPSPPLKLAFVVITHPDEDHYKGLDKILNAFPGRVERVCRYHGTGIPELKAYVAQQRLAGTYDLAGFADIERAMQKAGALGAHLKRLGEMTLVFERKEFPIEGYGRADIRMIALSPSSSSVEKYSRALLEELRPKKGSQILPVYKELHNLISVALLLTISDLQIVLGSDLEKGEEKTGWNGVLINGDCPDLWATMVKVSHHGSEDAFNPDVWERHCRKSKPIGIISPFNRGNPALPKLDQIERLKALTGKLGITSSLKELTNIHKLYRRDVVTAIRNSTRTAKIYESTEETGFIRLRFLPDGKLSSYHTEVPAFWA